MPVLFRLAAVLLLAACSRSAPDAPPRSPSTADREPVRDVILVVVDTLRDDAIDQARTPTFDAVAAAGQRVELAWSAATWTAPSVISIFTGMPVRAHGWNLAFPRDMPAGENTTYPPLPDVPTLAEVLRDAGFRTDGVFGNKTLTWPLGFDRGFETWDYTRDAKIASHVVARISQWKPDDRHFLYLHLLGPHHPLKPTSSARKRWQLPPKLFKGKRRFSQKRVWRAPDRWLDLYKQAYLAATEDADDRIGSILAALGSRREHALVIITSDHGELLGEHGQLGHHRYVWEELTHVPLAVQGAGPLPRALRLDALADLVTTSAGIPHAWMSTIADPLPLVSQREDKLAFSPDGRVKALWGEDGATGSLGRTRVDPAVASTRSDDDEGDEGGDTAAPATQMPPVDPAPVDTPVLVFDLSTDPTEGSPLPDRDATLRAARTAWEARTPHRAPGKGTVSMPEHARDALKALGYLDE